MTLHLSAISKAFGSTPVLHEVTLDVARSERLALVGSSGSGKSTLLRLIAGFERPDAGTISWEGQELASPRASVPAHRRGIGYVAQDGALFPHLSVARNIAFGLPRDARRTSRVRELMEMVSLDATFAARRPHELSGGQQQRVALARALAQQPAVILLDEPFSALDTGLRAHTRRVVVEVLERSGVTAVLVTHDQEEALSFGQQVGVLTEGRLVQSGNPSAVFDSPVSLEVAAFLGEVVVVPAVRTGDQVDCALGRVSVRRDLSRGAAEVVAMVRPDQLRVEEAADGRMEVADVRRSGAAVELTLRARRPGVAVEIRHRLPAHRADAFYVGASVRMQVDDGVVLYPAEPASGGQGSVRRVDA